MKDLFVRESASTQIGMFGGYRMHRRLCEASVQGKMAGHHMVWLCPYFHVFGFACPNTCL